MVEKLYILHVHMQLRMVYRKFFEQFWEDLDEVVQGILHKVLLIEGTKWTCGRHKINSFGLKRRHRYCIYNSEKLYLTRVLV